MKYFLIFYCLIIQISAGDIFEPNIEAEIKSTMAKIPLKVGENREQVEEKLRKQLQKRYSFFAVQQLIEDTRKHHKKHLERFKDLLALYASPEDRNLSVEKELLYLVLGRYGLNKGSQPSKERYKDQVNHALSFIIHFGGYEKSQANQYTGKYSWQEDFHSHKKRVFNALKIILNEDWKGKEKNVQHISFTVLFTLKALYDGAEKYRKEGAFKESFFDYIQKDETYNGLGALSKGIGDYIKAKHSNEESLNDYIEDQGYNLLRNDFFNFIQIPSHFINKGKEFSYNDAQDIHLELYNRFQGEIGTKNKIIYDIKAERKKIPADGACVFSSYIASKEGYEKWLDKHTPCSRKDLMKPIEDKKNVPIIKYLLALVKIDVYPTQDKIKEWYNKTDEIIDGFTNKGEWLPRSLDLMALMSYIYKVDVLEFWAKDRDTDIFQLKKARATPFSSKKIWIFRHINHSTYLHNVELKLNETAQ